MQTVLTIWATEPPSATYGRYFTGVEKIIAKTTAGMALKTKSRR